jgi:integrase
VVALVRLAVRLVVVTGLRRREVATLRWSDFHGDHLLIARHKYRQGGRT